MIQKIENAIGTRDWTQDDLEKYLGPHQEAWFSYSADDSIRKGAASGGSVTAIFCHLLETSQIDGVLAVKTIVEDGMPRPEFFIAKSREELLRARGSKYSAVYFARHALPLLKAFDGDLAAVLLPCDARALHLARQRDQELNSKIKLVISLVCGHNSEPELTQLVVEKHHHGRPAHTCRFLQSSGAWRGRRRRFQFRHAGNRLPGHARVPHQ